MTARTDAAEQPWWEVVCEVPPEIMAGGLLPCLFPAIAIEGYAGQLGLTDVSVLVDVLVHMPMLRVHQAAGELPLVFPTRVSEEAAREALLGLVAQVKSLHDGGVVQHASALRDPDAPSDLLAPIRQTVLVLDHVADRQFLSDLERLEHGVVQERISYVNGVTPDSYGAALRALHGTAPLAAPGSGRARAQP
ncbi:hypothetical protein [Bailinhaonella thermotolerans]|uniref:hypothetical protein n=1 Tax=Bailinhaonella thermotolerans TaxID=1070861 RepID=UPI0011C43620|nr:hypothetical protein [Bailinhaonella thermotolerans]